MRIESQFPKEVYKTHIYGYHNFILRLTISKEEFIDNGRVVGQIE